MTVVAPWNDPSSSRACVSPPGINFKWASCTCASVQTVDLGSIYRQVSHLENQIRADRAPHSSHISGRTTFHRGDSRLTCLRWAWRVPSVDVKREKVTFIIGLFGRDNMLDYSYTSPWLTTNIQANKGRILVENYSQDWTSLTERYASVDGYLERCLTGVRSNPLKTVRDMQKKGACHAIRAIEQVRCTDTRTRLRFRSCAQEISVVHKVLSYSPE